MLTITQATKQARKHVNATMPGVMATVESRGTADPQTLKPLMRTTVTFPKGQYGSTGLAALLASLPGVISRHVADSSIVIIRER